MDVAVELMGAVLVPAIVALGGWNLFKGLVNDA